MLYSDGMVEYRRDILDGERRLREAVREAILARRPDPASVIQNSVFGDAAPRDDAIVLVIRGDFWTRSESTSAPCRKAVERRAS